MSELLEFQRRSLTTIERYMLRSARLGGSLEFASEADFDGEIDGEVFAAAVRFTLAHHPLMASVVDGSGGAPQWRATSIENVFQQRRAASLGKPFDDAIESIDPTRSPGVRIRLTSTADGCSRIVAHYHHACADGQGAARFFRDICAVYACLLCGTVPKLNLEPGRLDKREQFHPPDGSAPIGLIEGLRNLWVTTRGQTAGFAKLAERPAAGAASSLVVEAQLDDALTQQIRRYLRQQQRVLNDFAVAAALLMLAQTETLGRAANPGRAPYLTILNPVDLRGWTDRRLSAANRVGFAIIRRRPQDWTTAGSLLDSVDQQLRYVRRRGVAAELIKGVALVERIPGCLSLLEKSQRFRSTALLTCMSNLSIGRRHGLLRHGDRWKLGEATVRRISVAAPLPPAVPLAIAVIDSGGKLMITIRGCCQHFTQPHLDRLIAGWRLGCEMICQSPPK